MKEDALDLVLIDSVLAGLIEFEEGLVHIFKHHLHIPFLPENFFDFDDVGVIKGC